MPLASKAQWRKWAVLMREGKVTRAQFNEATQASRPYRSLPQRLMGKPRPAATGGREQ